MKFIKFIIIVFISILILHFIPIKEERKDVKIPVLLYHDFICEISENNQIDFNYVNSVQSFEENIKTLIENGYTIISLEEINKEDLPQKPIVITFDDGYYSNYEYIYPILKKYNTKASIFIVTDKIGKKENGQKYLGWEECLEMQNSGLVEIFSHSRRHLFYTRLPLYEFYNDVLDSNKKIKENLGEKEFNAFAYPYGAYTRRMVILLNLSGIDMQLYDLGINNFKDFNSSYVKRINIPYEMTGIEIIQEINK